MIYNQRNFVDTSQIINSYVVYQENATSPLILQPSFVQTNAERHEASERLPVYRKRETNWVDSFAAIIEKAVKDLFGDFLTEWEEPLLQLKAFVEDETNPSLEKPSSHSVFTAFIYLFAIYQLQPKLCPELALTGDGGIYLEWQLDDKFVSIQIDREKSEKDRIYIEQGDEYGSTKLTEDTLKEVFGE
jgi:hypothetical protein